MKPGSACPRYSLSALIDSDPPWVSFLVVSEAGGRQLGRVVVSVVGGLDLGWGAHVEFAVEPAVVPPPDPFQGRELDLLDRAPRALEADQLGLVQAVDRLGVSVDAPIGQDFAWWPGFAVAGGRGDRS